MEKKKKKIIKVGNAHDEGKGRLLRTQKGKKEGLIQKMVTWREKQPARKTVQQREGSGRKEVTEGTKIAMKK